MNSSAAPSKRSTIEKGMDKIVISMLGLLCLMGTITGIICGSWIKNVSPKHWYMDTSDTDMVFDPKNAPKVGVVAFLTSYVLYGYLIPISLYVSLEFVKVCQAMVFLNSDRQMYHEETDTPMRARTSNLNEELGMVHTVLSDKTGTLTCNSMEFFKCSIAGVSYGEGVTEIERSIAKRQGRPILTKPTKPIEPGFNFKDARLEGDKWRSLPDAEHIRDFFRILGVCHTVIPEGEATRETICYQAESPDESAFVVAAKRFGFFFKSRTTSGMELEEPSFPSSGEMSTVHYELLNVLEFNSTRKRMSVIVRTPEDKIMLYCKGADSVIYDRLSHGNQKYIDVTQQHMDEYAKCGLRTLCLSVREISQSEYDAWNVTYTEAAQSLEKRDEKLQAAAEIIEKDLFLVGATAIEDKLQDGVPGTIEQMMRGGIAVWVLTGDKQDTAINIAQACALIRDDMDVHIVNIEELVKQEHDREITRAQFNEQGKAQVAALIEEGIEKEAATAKKGMETCLVIDGRSLSFALEQDLAPRFLQLGSGCTSVVCCRVSPLQKALVTKLVKDSGKITLAIGDGANDVGMIQSAHIGVGISGQEGMQAVMASDFAFAQFRFLERLLLVHGRYNYKRISKMVTYFFYKNLAFGLTLFMYNLHAAASGQVVYNDWLMSAFNIFFVAFPVIALGILDQDVNQRSCLQFPQLYRQGQQNACFERRVQAGLGAERRLHRHGDVLCGVLRGARRRGGPPQGPRVWPVGGWYVAVHGHRHHHQPADGSDDQLLDVDPARMHLGIHRVLVHRQLHPQQHRPVPVHVLVQDIHTHHRAHPKVLDGDAAHRGHRAAPGPPLQDVAAAIPTRAAPARAGVRTDGAGRDAQELGDQHPDGHAEARQQVRKQRGVGRGGTDRGGRARGRRGKYRAR